MITLPRQLITPENEAHWLDLRKPNINSTEISALFGVCPYMTEFDLWHRKKGNYDPEFKGNSRLNWGRRFEPVVADGIAEDEGWTVEPFKQYGVIPDLRLGSSFDFRILAPMQALLEIKCVDYLVFRDNWIVTDGEIEAPPHIEIQAQHEMLVAGIDRLCIGAMVSGNSVKLIWREADEEFQQLILTKAKNFWKSIADNIEPETDYARDADVIIALNQRVQDGKWIEADADLSQLIREYSMVCSDMKRLKENQDALKAQIFEASGEAVKITTPDGMFSVAMGMVAGKAGTLVTEDMVGSVIGESKGYRMLKVTARKPK